MSFPVRVTVSGHLVRQLVHSRISGSYTPSSPYGFLRACIEISHKYCPFLDNRRITGYVGKNTKEFSSSPIQSINTARCLSLRQLVPNSTPCFSSNSIRAGYLTVT